MEKSLLKYFLTAALIGTLLGAVVTNMFLIPRLDQIDSLNIELGLLEIRISELETAIDDRLSVVEEYLTAPFSMQVWPDHMEAIVGQRCVFLVVVADEGLGEGGAVNISASALNASVTVNPQAITPELSPTVLGGGTVAEVTVIPKEVIRGANGPQPDPEPPLYNLTVTIAGARDGYEQTDTVTVNVWRGEDGLSPAASERRDRFVPWLSVNHPELGITNETEWNGTIVVPGMLEVSYYLFFSDDWEMGVKWHVTIIPDDYVEIYLRRRYVEVQPSYAFRIDSWYTEPPLDPHIIDPLELKPEPPWR